MINNLCSNYVTSQTWLSLECGLNFQASILYPDSTTGKLFVGGSFGNYQNCINGDGVAAWDGTSWDSTYSLHAIGADIRAITRFQQHLYVGGNAMFSNGHRIQGFTRWNGTSWDSLGTHPNPHLSIFPNHFCEYNNQLIVVGDFDSVHNYNSHIAAAWDGTIWSPMGLSSFFDSYQGWSCIVFNNELYFGGHIFDTTYYLHSFFKWSGNTWNEVDSHLTGTVNSFAIYNNELYIGGGFYYNNVYHSVLKYDGTNFYPVGSKFVGLVYSLKVIENKLFAVGNFDTAGGVRASEIAVWDGNGWEAFSNDSFSIGTTITDVAEYNHQLYITGSIWSINGDTSFHNIAMYSSPLGVMELLEKKGEVSIYPNPASNTITLHLSSYTPIAEAHTLSITDVFGREVYKEAVRGIDTKIEVSKWSGGVYFYEVRGDGITNPAQQSVRGKFVVQK